MRKNWSGAGHSLPIANVGAPIQIDFELGSLTRQAQERAQAALVAAIPDEDDLPVELKSCRLGQDVVGRDAQAPGYKKISESQTKSRDKARFKQLRRAARERHAQEASVKESLGRHIKLVSLKNRSRARALPVSIDIGDAGRSSKGSSIAATVASTGFVGQRLSLKPEDRQLLTKADALKLGFQYVEWDGRETRPLLDQASRVFAVLAGRPRDAEGWEKVNAEAEEAFDAARSTYKLNDKQITHRRGSFPAIAAGISYGGGQKHVSNLSHSAQNRKIVEELLRSPALQRIAGFADATFKLYAPRLHGYYAETMKVLLQDNPALRPSFQKNVFGSTTFNLGPQVVTHVHTDHLNLPAGWCAITAIGRFDPREGGHLLLWDLNLMVEFPPGALILIPSAILRHSNTAVRPSEKRCSFTQYSAGGLFRWVECGCKSQKEFSAAGGVHSISGEERWLRGVDMWSTWDELQHGIP